MSNKKDSEDNLVSASVLALGLGLVSGLVSVLGLGLALVSVLVSASVLGLALGLALGSEEDAEKFAVLFFIFYIIGAILGGYIGYQQTQIQSLQAGTTTTTIPPSTYQGVVQAIYTDHPSYISFTSGSSWYGNVSRVANLSIGSVCTLMQNSSMESISSTPYFTSGTCYKR